MGWYQEKSLPEKATQEKGHPEKLQTKKNIPIGKFPNSYIVSVCKQLKICFSMVWSFFGKFFLDDIFLGWLLPKFLPNFLISYYNYIQYQIHVYITFFVSNNNDLFTS